MFTFAGIRTYKPPSGHGPTAEPHIPHVVVTDVLYEVDKGCPCRGGALTEMIGQFESSDIVDVSEVEYSVGDNRRTSTARLRPLCGHGLAGSRGAGAYRGCARCSVDFATKAAVTCARAPDPHHGAARGGYDVAGLVGSAPGGRDAARADLAGDA